MGTSTVELFERGGGFVAAGNCEQWSETHTLLCDYIRDPANDVDYVRANRVTGLAWNAIFRADDAGRCSIELFDNEAEMIRKAIAREDA